MNGTNRDTGRNTGAIILIVIGVVVLLSQMFNINLWNMFGGLFDFSWPLWIILPGLAVLALGMFGSRQIVGMTIPGAVITGTGLILWFQDRTNYYESWAYLWGLYPVFVGCALVFMGMRTGNHGQVDAGRKTITVGIVLTAVFGILMESIFRGGFDGIFRYLLPVLLIGGGAVLLLTNRHRMPAPLVEKPKPIYFEKPKHNPALVNPTLQRQIDEALAEDDEPTPTR